MTKRTWIRLARVLLVLVVVLGISAVPAHKADAAQCCETCDAGELACDTAPTTGPCYGNANCCFSLWASCYRSCIICG